MEYVSGTLVNTIGPPCTASCMAAAQCSVQTELEAGASQACTDAQSSLSLDMSQAARSHTVQLLLEPLKQRLIAQATTEVIFAPDCSPSWL